MKFRILIILVYIFLIIPNIIFYANNNLIYGVFLFTGLVYIMNIAQGASIIILALCLVIPYSPNTDNSLSIYIADKLWLPFNFIRLMIFISYLYFLYMKKRLIIHKNIVILLIFLMIISLSFYFKTNDIKEISDNVSWFLYSYIIFYITSNEDIFFKRYLFYIDILFFMTFFYAILEFIFQISPYQFLYEQYTFFETIRAKGLLGHPLILSAFLAFYQALVLSKFIIYNKIPFITYPCVLILSLMTASRTIIILLAITLIFFIIIQFNQKKRKKLLLFSTIVTCASMLIYFFFIEFFNNSFYRFYTATSNQRIGAYDAVWQIFQNNPFGVGITQLSNELTNRKYNISAVFDKEMRLIDNMYLTSIGRYGVFSILIFLFYAFPLIHYRRVIQISCNINLKHILFLIYIVWFFLNFSFETNLYLPINVFFFMSISFIIKEMKNNILLLNKFHFND